MWRDDLPYYKECDACVHGGNYQPFWHPFPQVNPKDGVYLVTTKSEQVKIMEFDNGDFYDAMAWINESQNKNITAWAELPKPYECHECASVRKNL